MEAEGARSQRRVEGVRPVSPGYWRPNGSAGRASAWLWPGRYREPAARAVPQRSPGGAPGVSIPGRDAS